MRREPTDVAQFSDLVVFQRGQARKRVLQIGIRIVPIQPRTARPVPRAPQSGHRARPIFPSGVRPSRAVAVRRGGPGMRYAWSTVCPSGSRQRYWRLAGLSGATTPRSRLPRPHAARANPAPAPATGRCRPRRGGHATHPPIRTCLGSTGARPTALRSRRVPAPSCGWRAGLRRNWRGAHGPRRTPPRSGTTLPRCQHTCPATR